MSSRASAQSIQLTGWAMFAAIWLVVAGSFNVINGITAIHKSNYLANQFLFSNLDFWGWVLLIVGVVQLVAGFMVFGGNPTGNTLGICVAAFAIFVWFFFLFAAPLGALIALIANGLVVYGLSIGSEP